jgi:hypothetical protein
MAYGRVAESQSGETPEPPFSAALGLAAALSFAFFGVCTSLIAVVGRDPRTPLLCCARHGRCARLCLLRRLCELGCRSRESPQTPFFHSARPGLCAQLGLVRRAYEFNCRSRGRSPNPLHRGARPGHKGRVSKCQAALCDDQSEAWVLPWRESSARALRLMIRRWCGSSEGLGATYHGLLSPLLLGAGARVSVGHFAGLLAAKRRTAPSVWHLSALPSSLCCCRFSSQVNTLPKAKSKTRSKKNKDINECSSGYSERGVPLPVFTSGGE